MFNKINDLPNLTSDEFNIAITYWESLFNPHIENRYENLKGIGPQLEAKLDGARSEKILTFIKNFSEIIDAIISFAKLSAEKWGEMHSDSILGGDQFIYYWAILMRKLSEDKTFVLDQEKITLSYDFAQEAKFGETAFTLYSILPAFQSAQAENITDAQLASGDEQANIPGAELTLQQAESIANAIKTEWPNKAIETGLMRSTNIKMEDDHVKQLHDLFNVLIKQASDRNPFHFKSKQMAKNKLKILLGMIDIHADKQVIYQSSVGNTLYNAAKLVEQRNPESTIGFFKRPVISKARREAYLHFKADYRAIKLLELVQTFGQNLLNKPSVKKDFLKTLVKIRDREVLSKILSALDKMTFEHQINLYAKKNKNQVLIQLLRDPNIQWGPKDKKQIFQLINDLKIEKDNQRNAVMQKNRFRH